MTAVPAPASALSRKHCTVSGRRWVSASARQRPQQMTAGADLLAAFRPLTSAARLSRRWLAAPSGASASSPISIGRLGSLETPFPAAKQRGTQVVSMASAGGGSPTTGRFDGSPPDPPVSLLLPVPWGTLKCVAPFAGPCLQCAVHRSGPLEQTRCARRSHRCRAIARQPAPVVLAQPGPAALDSASAVPSCVIFLDFWHGMCAWTSTSDA